MQTQFNKNAANAALTAAGVNVTVAKIAHAAIAIAVKQNVIVKIATVAKTANAVLATAVRVNAIAAKMNALAVNVNHAR